LRSGSASWSRARRFRGRARADVRDVLAHTHFAKKHRLLENVIARRAATISPFSLDVGRSVIGAHLLTVTINAAVCGVNVRAALEHSRLGLRINVGAFLVGLRIEMPDLPVRNNGQSEPRKGERAEDSEKERSESFHQCPPEASASTGLRNVGTVDVRPNPKSINPK
jgi:hypothetical protein